MASALSSAAGGPSVKRIVLHVSCAVGTRDPFHYVPHYILRALRALVRDGAIKGGFGGISAECLCARSDSGGGGGGGGFHASGVCHCSSEGLVSIRFDLLVDVARGMANSDLTPLVLLTAWNPCAALLGWLGTFLNYVQSAVRSQPGASLAGDARSSFEAFFPAEHRFPLTSLRTLLPWQQHALGYLALHDSLQFSILQCVKPDMHFATLEQMKKACENTGQTIVLDVHVQFAMPAASEKTPLDVVALRSAATLLYESFAALVDLGFLESSVPPLDQFLLHCLCVGLQRIVLFGDEWVVSVCVRGFSRHFSLTDKARDAFACLRSLVLGSSLVEDLASSDSLLPGARFYGHQRYTAAMKYVALSLSGLLRRGREPPAPVLFFPSPEAFEHYAALANWLREIANLLQTERRHATEAAEGTAAPEIAAAGQKGARCRSRIDAALATIVDRSPPAPSSCPPFFFSSDAAATAAGSGPSPSVAAAKHSDLYFWRSSLPFMGSRVLPPLCRPKRLRDVGSQHLTQRAFCSEHIQRVTNPALQYMLGMHLIARRERRTLRIEDTPTGDALSNFLLSLSPLCDRFTVATGETAPTSSSSSSSLVRGPVSSARAAGVVECVQWTPGVAAGGTFLQTCIRKALCAHPKQKAGPGGQHASLSSAAAAPVSSSSSSSSSASSSVSPLSASSSPDDDVPFVWISAKGVPENAVLALAFSEDTTAVENAAKKSRTSQDMLPSRTARAAPKAVDASDAEDTSEADASATEEEVDFPEEKREDGMSAALVRLILRGKKDKLFSNMCGDPVGVEQLALQAFTTCFDPAALLSSTKSKYERGPPGGNARVKSGEKAAAHDLCFPPQATPAKREEAHVCVPIGRAMHTFSPWASWHDEFRDVFERERVEASLQRPCRGMRIPVDILGKVGAILPPLGGKMCYALDGGVGSWTRGDGNRPGRMPWDLVLVSESNSALPSPPSSAAAASSSSSSSSSAPVKPALLSSSAGRSIQNGWSGVHGENALGIALYTICMWDVIYVQVSDIRKCLLGHRRQQVDAAFDALASEPPFAISRALFEMADGELLSLAELLAGAWKHPWQVAPLDYPSRLSETRDSLFRLRLGQIGRLTPCELAAMVSEVWERNAGTPGLMRWDLFSRQDVCEIVHAAGGAAVAELLARLEGLPCETSGMPDLLLWRPLPCPFCARSCTGPTACDVDVEAYPLAPCGLSFSAHADAATAHAAAASAPPPAFKFFFSDRARAHLGQRRGRDLVLMEVKSANDQLREHQHAALAGIRHCIAGIVRVKAV